jgi:electron-transferring-flavoprotein dehydrogenase
MSDDDFERDELPCGALFVGAGPANLAAAIRLADLVTAHNEAVEAGTVQGEMIDLEEQPIMVIEKASEVGEHNMSGAVMDPRALAELIPNFNEHDPPPPFEGPALEDSVVLMLPGGGKITAPIVPPNFHNEGNYITSLNKLVKWLAEIAEEKGVMIMPGFPGAEVLFDDDGGVRGVRTVDKGIDKNGERKDNFEPGNDLTAPITVFGEGSRGSLTRELVRRFNLRKGRNPQIYSTGCKEVWKVPAGRLKPGEVIHTAGAPLSLTGDEFGGGFVYAFADDHVSLGFVVSLDSPDPTLDPHRLFSEWKQHPFISRILEGGEVVRYGAKTIPEGGWFSLPRPYMPGALLVGDSAGFLNITRLKGIHLSMKSGMLAGETVFDILKQAAVSGEEPVAGLGETKAYWERILDSWLFEEMWKVRNFRQGFQKRPFGFIRGGMAAGLHLQSGGLWPPGRLGLQDDHHRMRKITDRVDGRWKRPPQPLPPTTATAADVACKIKDGFEVVAPKAPPVPLPEPSVKSNGVVFDKVTDVYHSGSTHEEDQPPHLVIADYDVCHTRCTQEYGNPCQYFCPAGVYEMADTDDGEGRTLRLNFSNCVHCKTCDIRDPYQVITWVTPESGGPVYSGL